MTERKRLLNKYFSGETTLEEEKELKSLFIEDVKPSAEQEIFGYFESKTKIPDMLEENILSTLENKQKKGKTVRMRVLSIASAAAVVLIFLSIFIDTKNKRNTQMENNFFVMEQAILRVSESLQPDVQDEMIVLWIDNDVEIIIN